MIAEKQIQETVNTLREIQPGKIPFDIFSQIARLSVTPVVEVVPYKKEANGSISVLLLQRSEDDPNWAGQFHVPGTIVLATDTKPAFAEALSRCMDKLQSPTTSQPVFVTTTLCTVSRGTEAALVFAVELLDEPQAGKFYASDSLPENMIAGQHEFVEAAIEKIKAI